MEKTPSIPPPPGTLSAAFTDHATLLFVFFIPRSQNPPSGFLAAFILQGKQASILLFFPLCAMRMILSDGMNYNPGMMTGDDSCTIWSQKPPFCSKRRVFLPFEAVSVCSYSVRLPRGRARWLLVILQESWSVLVPAGQH